MGEPWPPQALRALQPELAAPADPAVAAVALYAKVLAATSLASAAHALVAAVAAEGGFDRVSFARHEHGRTRLLASTGLDLSGRSAEAPRALIGAMDEAIEQGVLLRWPPAEGQADLICIEQQALQRESAARWPRCRWASTARSSARCAWSATTAPPLSVADGERLEATLALALPALRWMQQGAEPFFRRARRDAARWATALRQPDRRTQRRLIVAGAPCWPSSRWRRCSTRSAAARASRARSSVCCRRPPTASSRPPMCARATACAPARRWSTCSSRTCGWNASAGAASSRSTKTPMPRRWRGPTASPPPPAWSASPRRRRSWRWSIRSSRAGASRRPSTASWCRATSASRSAHRCARAMRC